MECQHRTQAHSQQAGEARIGQGPNEQCAPDHEEEEGQNKDGPHESEFLANDGEDKIRMGRWQEFVFRLRALQEALAGRSTGADRDLRLDDVPA